MVDRHGFYMWSLVLGVPFDKIVTSKQRCKEMNPFNVRLIGKVSLDALKVKAMSSDRKDKRIKELLKKFRRAALRNSEKESLIDSLTLELGATKLNLEISEKEIIEQSTIINVLRNNQKIFDDAHADEIKILMAEIKGLEKGNQALLARVKTVESDWKKYGQEAK